MRKLTLITITLAIAFTAVGQAPTASGASKTPICTMKPSEFPAIRGLKLGMTRAEIAAVYPTMTIGANDEAGDTHALLGDEELSEVDPALGAGLHILSLGMNDDRVYELSFYYSDEPLWLSIVEFRDTFSKSLSLPRIWDRLSETNSSAQCDGFTVTLFMRGHSKPVVSLMDMKRLSEIVERRNAIRERQRQNELKVFKP